jgi:hypothetical protein
MRFTREAVESFETHTFPTTTGELIDAHGNVEIQFPNGSTTLGEVLGRLPGEELETQEDAMMTIYGVLGEEAIGRKGYSDRDPTCPGEEGHEPVSL